MNEFDFSFQIKQGPIIGLRPKCVIGVGTAMLIGGGMSLGGSILSSRSASKSARKTRKMMEALYAEEARRRESALKIHKQIVATYAPGGTGWETGMGMVDRSVRRGVAGATQGLVSSGLAGTSVKAGLPIRAEEQIGMPGRENVLGRYTSALQNQAAQVGISPFASGGAIPMAQAAGGLGVSNTGRMLSSLSDLPYMLAMVNKMKPISQIGNSWGSFGSAAKGGASMNQLAGMANTWRG